MKRNLLIGFIVLFAFIIIIIIGVGINKNIQDGIDAKDAKDITGPTRPTGPTGPTRPIEPNTPAPAPTPTPDGGLKITNNLNVKNKAILDKIKTRLDNLEKLPDSMRLFQMTVDNTWNMKVVDSNNNSFDADDWVCSVQGLSMDYKASMNDIKEIYQFCYIKEGEWWIKSAMAPAGTQTGRPIILAIPRIFFVKNDKSTFI